MIASIESRLLLLSPLVFSASKQSLFNCSTSSSSSSPFTPASRPNSGRYFEPHRRPIKNRFRQSRRRSVSDWFKRQLSWWHSPWQSTKWQSSSDLQAVTEVMDWFTVAIGKIMSLSRRTRWWGWGRLESLSFAAASASRYPKWLYFTSQSSNFGVERWKRRKKCNRSRASWRRSRVLRNCKQTKKV